MSSSVRARKLCNCRELCVHMTPDNASLSLHNTICSPTGWSIVVAKLTYALISTCWDLPVRPLVADRTHSALKRQIDFYSAPLWEARLWRPHTVFTQQTHHTCFYLISIHQTAPPLSSDSSHLIAAYYSFIDPKRMRGWVGHVSWHKRTVYPYKWLSVNCRSGAGQWKFTGQRPTFYHWATPHRGLHSLSSFSQLSVTARSLIRFSSTLHLTIT